MTRREAALMAAGSAALASSTLAVLVIRLLLTRPSEVVEIATAGALMGLVELAAQAFADLMIRLLQYL